MYLRSAAAASICFSTMWFLGCDLNPDGPPAAVQNRPTDPPPTDTTIEITDQIFLLREGAVCLTPKPVTVAGMHTEHVEEFASTSRDWESGRVPLPSVGRQSICRSNACARKSGRLSPHTRPRGERASRLLCPHGDGHTAGWHKPIGPASKRPGDRPAGI